MGFRFRRSLSIIPGLKLNLSKSGISTSMGGRGAFINFSRRGIRTTLGLPGTGLSYSTLSSPIAQSSVDLTHASDEAKGGGIGWAILIFVALGAVLLGSIFGNSLKKNEPAPPMARHAVDRLIVTANVLNCRFGPGTYEPRLNRLQKGQIVSATPAKRVDGWVQVDLGPSQCWALGEYVAPAPVSQR